MNKIEITNIENIYLENQPKYITIFYKNKAYGLIIERFGYKDFNFYYSGDSIPDKDIKEEIEDFLYKEFLDYSKWNLYERKVI